jgi:hypothetical protein
MIKLELEFMRKMYLIVIFYEVVGFRIMLPSYVSKC